MTVRFDDIRFRKESPGYYTILRDGERIGATATHPRVFPRHWWAKIGEGTDAITGTGRTRGEALVDAFAKQRQREEARP